MNKLLVFAVLLGAIIIAPSSSSGLNPAQSSNQDVSMLFARQAEDPVRIVQASFGADNMLLDAHLENKSHNKVQTYRLGWAVIKKEDVRIGKGGELVTVPQDVDTTAGFDIPGQGLPGKEELSKHPTGVVVYVAELQFQDGSKWQADIKKIKKEAVGMVK
ncbi:MAG TPA: hypothetical protein VGR76_08555 [Candidatus Angelobacter sp.]|nr:hypothetical protein [Candidatus Angelobacter sp.]